MKVVANQLLIRKANMLDNIDVNDKKFLKQHFRGYRSSVYGTEKAIYDKKILI